jgi:signal transduction histidine kinase
MSAKFTIGQRLAEEQDIDRGSSSDAPRASYDTSRMDTKRYHSFTSRMSLAMSATVVFTVVALLVALVGVWSVPGSPLTKEEAVFRQNTFSAVLFAGIIAITVSSIIAYIMANSLAKPVNRITSTARQIRNGDLTARTQLSGEDELGKLGETFDDMANHLEKDMQMEHRLTSDVAHELRTPLMAMQATVEAMRDGVMPADDEHLASVEHEVRRLSRLVDAILKLSRIENGTTPFRPQRTEMIGLVRSIYDNQHQLFHDSGLRLRLRVDTAREEVYADVDRDMIRQCIVNLLSNALRYTEPGGYVILKLDQDRTDVLISVQDTGIGIAKEDLANVFGRFWRAENSRERVAGGLGVGLAVTKEIVDRHKGYITVESELGKGTTFTLHLPRVRFSLVGAEEADLERDLPVEE